MIEFEKIKKIASGYLDVRVYEKIYNYAKENDKDGIVLEIGPAQGASTICFAMAMKKNKHILKIVSIDKFYGSAALKYIDNIEENINVIKKNLEYFNLTPSIDFIPFKEIEENYYNNISFLFIDADGAIDRDFKRYFNNIMNGGIVVIDDYEKKLNLQARTRFLKMQSIKNVNSFLEHNCIKKVEEYSFLGKHYLTFSIVNYLISEGFIEVLENLNGTIFCKKKSNAPIYCEKNNMKILQLRKIQSNLYLKFRKIIADKYKQLDFNLLKTMEAFNMSNAIVYSCYYYELKERMQMAKVYELHKRIGEYIQDDYFIQDINLEMINDIDFSKDICVLFEHKNIISYFLNQLKYNKIVYIMLKKDKFLHGIVVLYDNTYNNSISREELDEIIIKLRNIFCEIEYDVEKVLFELEKEM